MARKIKKGATDISVILRAIDSTTGAPKTDFAYNTAGIDLWYRRNGATVTSITEATLAAADTAHSDGGVIHLGNGYFRLDSPDAAFATGVNSVMFGGTATGVIIIGTEIQLVNYDPEDAVRLGLTALPPADADAPGGIPISDAGALDLDAKLANTNEITTARMGALTDWIDGGRLDLLIDAILADTAEIQAELADGGRTDLLIDSIVTDVAAVHVHVGTIDGHITADYGATEKAAIDLLDDVDGGLADIHTVANTILADTAELQTDWHDGGRLDLLLDAAGSGGDATEAKQDTIIAAIGALENLSAAEAQTAATASLNAYDPPTNAEMLAAIASVSGLSGSNTATITVQDGAGNNVIGAYVDIMDSANTVLLQRLITDSSGQALFNMDNDDYYIRIIKAGYTFAAAAFTVSGDYTHTYNMTPFTTPTASNASMCRVYGYFMTPEGGYYATLTPSAVVEETYDSGNNFFKGDVTGGYVAATGLVYWDIVRGATARVRIPEIGYEAQITVPAASSSELDDLV